MRVKEREREREEERGERENKYVTDKYSFMQFFKIIIESL